MKAADLEPLKGQLHPGRTAILYALRDGPRSQLDVAEAVGMKQPHVSNLMRLLREEGVIDRDGRGFFLTRPWDQVAAEIAEDLGFLESRARRLRARLHGRDAP